jgi:dihydroorotase
MPEKIDTITLRRPDDWRVRLIDGTLLAAVMPDRKGGR